MLSFTKKIDYALIVLGYLAEHSATVVSAREISAHFGMSAALVMNVMKALHRCDFITSTRGTKGGYRLIADLSKVSVHDLIAIVEGPVRLAECIALDGECRKGRTCKLFRACPIQKLVETIHGRVVSLLKDVKLAEILPQVKGAAGRAGQASLAAAGAG
jgi:Rrf2 family transcriptional regulator, nitric oxide-sensitive transcriptional repressor